MRDRSGNYARLKHSRSAATALLLTLVLIGVQLLICGGQLCVPARCSSRRAMCDTSER